MNGKQIAGQIFLWAGFVSAALAATRQLEIDLLPDTEKAALSQLPDDLTVPKNDLQAELGKPVSELDPTELDAAVKSAKAIHEAAIKESVVGDSADGAVVDLVVPKDQEKSDAPPVAQLTKSDFEKARIGRVENKWPTVNWLWYGLSMAVGLVGVVLLRSTAKAAEQDQGQVDADYSTLQKSLDVLNERVANLDSELSSMSPGQSVRYIDDQLAFHFGEFADARNSLVQRFGLQPYAEIMTQFASAERFVNRAWSASADGYMNEASDCIARAKTHLVQARQILQKCESDST